MMSIQVYKLSYLYEILKSYEQENGVQIYYTNILPLDADYIFIPNDRSIVSFVDISKTIVMLDTFQTDDVIWWMNQGVLDCLDMNASIELEWTKIKTN